MHRDLSKGVTVAPAEHNEPSDHEHLPGDGHETVVHDDHIDHIHHGEHHPEARIHVGHETPHTEDDDCEKIAHGGHVDHIHDGHRHFQHDDHVHEH